MAFEKLNATMEWISGLFYENPLTPAGRQRKTNYRQKSTLVGE